MFVTKAEIEERKAQVPRTRSYPAMVCVRFANAETEAQGVADAIELDIESQNAAVFGFIYLSKSKFGFDEQAAGVFVKELQKLDAIEGEGNRNGS
jgi:hypothetical protein